VVEIQKTGATEEIPDNPQGLLTLVSSRADSDDRSVCPTNDQHMNNSRLIQRFSFASLAISVICGSICNAQTINWYPDTAEAARVAAAQNKTVLLHFGADWCRPCGQVETFVFTDPTVQRAFDQQLVAVKVDADTQKDLVEEFGVTSLPMDIAISPTGEILAKRKSPTVASSYLKMISDIETTRSKLEDSNSRIENAAYQIKQMAEKKSGVQAQTPSFAPEFPRKAPHQPAASSVKLKNQGRRVKNPFVQQSGSQAGARLASKPQGIPMAQGQVMPQPETIAAPMAMPKAMELPGQLTMPEELQLAAPLTPPASVAHDFSVPMAKTNDFVPQSGGAIEGELTVVNQAKPVARRNPALKRLDQSDIAARLVREQAQQKLENFKADPRIVMDDRFYGTQRAAQAANAVDAKYQAKINLTQEIAPDVDPQAVVGFVPPKAPNFGAETVANVMDRNVDPPGTKATLASSGHSALNKATQDSVVDRGLKQASETPAKPTYALHGKCPVALLTKSKWVDGEEEIGCVHRNRVYIFANQENLRLFQSAPDAYSPILAGYDPVIFEETGRLVDGMEEYGVFMGKTPKQRIVLFASSETRARFQLEPRRYLQSVRQAMDRSSTTTTTMR